MNHFDDELKRALRREEPSPDFTDRVMRRLAELQKRGKPMEKAEWLGRLTEFFRPTQMKWAMAGAMAVLMVIAGLGVLYRRENERRRLAEIAEGERAKEQVMLAMRIASAKLNVAQKIVQTASHEGESK
ncbi:MAG: hypothetical protein J2P21_00320 [Chloracidobacterium sp.]|nr:hypothetical protein [Chloracidobacterium sp.]